jgi:uncharacterized repeat protein (TIGR03803 family)
LADFCCASSLVTPHIKALSQIPTLLVLTSLIPAARAGGVFTVLYSFTGTNDGANPLAALVKGGDGYFYGTCQNGGRNNAGTVFKIDANGALTSLYSFGPVQTTIGYSVDVGWPQARLVRGSDGNFYGTTSNFRPSWLVPDGFGTMFKISTNGMLTSLYSFTGGNDGANPNGLVQGSDGSFYGTTSSGGVGGAGTVFRLTIVPDPQLTIIPSAANVVLTWPTNATGFTLQSTMNLSSPVWTAVSPAPIVVNGQNTVTNPINGTQQFFRLSQ